MALTRDVYASARFRRPYRRWACGIREHNGLLISSSAVWTDDPYNAMNVCIAPTRADDTNTVRLFR